MAGIPTSQACHTYSQGRAHADEDILASEDPTVPEGSIARAYAVGGQDNLGDMDMGLVGACDENARGVLHLVGPLQPTRGMA